MQAQPGFDTRTVLDGLTLDLYHNKSASLAVLGIGGRHIAVGAGSIQLAEPIRVDVLCAPGGAVRCRAGRHDPDGGTPSKMAG